MVKTQKHIATMMLFLLGLFLSFNVFYQQNNSSVSLTGSSENTMATIDFTEDCEIVEDEQISIKKPLSGLSKTGIQALYFEKTCPFNLFYLAIWLPPKIC